jgi:hypothetical protein
MCIAVDNGDKNRKTIANFQAEALTVIGELGGPTWLFLAIWRCEFLTRSTEIHFGCPLMRLAAKRAKLSITPRWMALRQPLRIGDSFPTVRLNLQYDTI